MVHSWESCSGGIHTAVQSSFCYTGESDTCLIFSQSMDYFPTYLVPSWFILFPFHIEIYEGANEMNTSQFCILITAVIGIIECIFDMRTAFERDIKRCVAVRVLHHLNGNWVHSKMSQKQGSLPLWCWTL